MYKRYINSIIIIIWENAIYFLVGFKFYEILAYI